LKSVVRDVGVESASERGLADSDQVVKLAVEQMVKLAFEQMVKHTVDSEVNFGSTEWSNLAAGEIPIKWAVAMPSKG
jgi:hypothetical protein